MAEGLCMKWKITIEEIKRTVDNIIKKYLKLPPYDRTSLIIIQDKEFSDATLRTSDAWNIMLVSKAYKSSRCIYYKKLWSDIRSSDLSEFLEIVQSFVWHDHVVSNCIKGSIERCCLLTKIFHATG